jgi:hypothetical protein
MNKKFIISWVVAFVVWTAGGYVVHVLWLSGDYERLANLARPEEAQEALMHFMLLAHVLMAGAFVWIYQRGIENKPWMEQGLRYGIAIALLAPIPTYMMYYVVQPTSGMLTIKQLTADSVVVILVALIVAFLNKPTAISSSEAA